MHYANQHHENGTYENYRKAMTDLNKFYAIAKDNVKFLNTLER